MKHELDYTAIRNKHEDHTRYRMFTLTVKIEYKYTDFESSNAKIYKKTEDNSNSDSKIITEYFLNVYNF